MYAVVNVAAGIVYGPRWFAIGDSFEVYAEVLGRLSPVGRGTRGSLELRNPLAGLATMPRRPGLVGLLCLLLGSTAVDGVSRWSAWSQLTGELGRPQHLLVYTLGLIVAMAIVERTVERPAERTVERTSEARQTPCGSPGLVSPLVQAASAGS